MENYIGKICPFCKTEIKEGEAVKVCPACGVAHHEVCWEENKGCAIFGCSEQHLEAPAAAPVAAPTAVCSNCGTAIAEGEAFCPGCGAAQEAPKPTVCGKCGAPIVDGDEFCGVCGEKVGLVVDAGVISAIDQFNAGVDKTNEANKKKPMIIIIIAAAVATVLLTILLLSPVLFPSVEKLCEKGRYEDAYEKAKGDEKEEVYAENVAAVQSAVSADNLKDPDSFDLRDAYYRETVNSDGDDLKQLVLYISGANSYGAKVSSYWLYTWNSSDDEWKYFCCVSSLEEEEYSYYDDDDERLEKLTNNVGRIIIESVMDDGMKLSNDSVDRINNLFEQDMLDDIDLID